MKIEFYEPPMCCSTGLCGFVVYPEKTPIVESERAAQELASFGIPTQLVVANLLIFCAPATPAEARWRRDLPDIMVEIISKFYSAGISPAGVNPKAVAVMKEVRIDISTQTSKAIDKNLLDQADFIITLCGDARESCPVVPGKVQKRHWALEDPARAEGTEEEIMDNFRAVRDQISKLVQELVTELLA